ncbi:MAG: AsmA family protein, partial [Bauldia sp.]
QGIAQFMPATAAAYGLANPYDPVASIDAQAHLMSDLLRQFGSVELALAAYNAGPGAVGACDCIPPYPETQAYVAKIMAMLDGFGALTAKGLWRGAPDQYTFTTAEIVLDQTTARGEINLDTRGARPLVNANLKLTELDLNTYASRGKDRRAAPPAAEGGGSKARSIEDLLEDTAPPGPRVKGYTKRDGWDEDPCDLATLGALDANAKLSIEKLTVGTFRLGQSDLTVALKNRVMTTTLDRVSLYEGTGTGTVMLDGTAESTASRTTDITLDGISAQPLLKDAAEVDRLTGKGRLALTLVGRGANEREIVETLDGRIAFSFADGAILGVNIPEMMRNLGKGNLGGLDTAPTDKTDFSEMTSSWT